MKRKSFMVLTGLAGATVLSGGYCLFLRSHNFREVVSVPQTLIPFCDSTLLITMGREFLSRSLRENDPEVILAQLGVSLYIKSENLADQLQEIIKRDFEEQRTTVLNGWVVSLTEARQCALFALNHAA